MLSTLEAIRDYFYTSTIAYTWIGPSAFNLIGLDHWIPHVRYLCLIDSFDGQHPRVKSPSHQQGTPTFNHCEEINAYLIEHKESVHFLTTTSPVLFLFFNEGLETLCNHLHIPIMLPPHHLVKKIDSKLATTRLGNQIGVTSVPHVLAKIDSFSTAQSLAAQHNLGEQWVVQTAYGDSGKTTFFIKTPEEYATYASAIESESCVKLMKKIRCQNIAIEGCATRHGTFVGPVLSELAGDPALTPYLGGWCGNDWQSSGWAFSIKQQVVEATKKLGAALYTQGYKGCFEVDYLLDLDTDHVYLGELNPRLSGVTALTSATPFCQEYLPLFLFHLLEFGDVDWKICPEFYNNASLYFESEHALGQLIFKHIDATLSIIEKAPVSGIYCLDDKGQLQFKYAGRSPLDIQDPQDVFLFRIMGQSEWGYPGSDLAILFTRIPIQKNGNLSPQAHLWVSALRDAYIMRAPNASEQLLIDRYRYPGASLK